MKIGDKFKVISYNHKKAKISEGIITNINEHSIMIIKTNVNGDKFKESFCIGDLIDKHKKKYFDQGFGMELITFEQRGNNIVPVKIIKRNNVSSIN